MSAIEIYHHSSQTTQAALQFSEYSSAPQSSSWFLGDVILPEQRGMNAFLYDYRGNKPAGNL